VGYTAEMESARVELDTITDTASVSACGQGCEWHQALMPVMQMASVRVRLKTKQLSPQCVRKRRPDLFLVETASAPVEVDTITYTLAAVSVCEKSD